MDRRVVAMLDDVVVAATSKGIPVVDGPIRLLQIGDRGWTLEDLPPPVLVLRRSAVEHNLAVMAAYAARHHVAIAPHGKTTMAPQLWHRQLAAGAWGITAATAGQARMMRAAGVERILVANELTDPASIRWAAGDVDASEGELACYVDSVPAVRLLEDGLRAAGARRPLAVLVELGHADGRTGCRDPNEAVEIGHVVRGSNRLRLAGVAGYEGTLARDRDQDSLDRVRAYLDAVREVADRLLADGALEDGAILTAGGSRYFDLVAERLGGWPEAAGVLVLLRSGCYLTHDAGAYERTSPLASQPAAGRFRPALEAWGSVLSRPERALAILGLGRRDVPFDEGYPIPLRVRRPDGRLDDLGGRGEITALNDQHAFCRVPEGVRLEVGDLVACGISHPCSAFDRWRVIPELDDEDRVVDAIATFF